MKIWNIKDSRFSMFNSWLWLLTAAVWTYAYVRKNEFAYLLPLVLALLVSAMYQLLARRQQRRELQSERLLKMLEQCAAGSRRGGNSAPESDGPSLLQKQNAVAAFYFGGATAPKKLRRSTSSDFENRCHLCGLDPATTTVEELEARWASSEPTEAPPGLPRRLHD